MPVIKRLYLVTGDRNWGVELVDPDRPRDPSKPSIPHTKRMEDVFRQLTPGSIVLHGGARGADTMAELTAPVVHMFSLRMPYAGWLGRGGGAARNTKMLAVALGLQSAGWKVTGLAFHDKLHESAGTFHMVKIMLDAGIPVHHVTINSIASLRAPKDLRTRCDDLKRARS